MLERSRALLPALLMAVVTAACAPAPVEESSTQEPVPPRQAQAGDDIAIGVDNPQVLSLWEDAEIARQTEDYARARARLQQAIALEPVNPVLWSRLAEIRLLQEESVQAENLAAKSNALAQGNPSLSYRNWLIIRHAREMRGDQEGTALAQRELDKLKDSARE